MVHLFFFYQDQGGTQFLTIVWRYKAQPPEHLTLLYSFSDDIPTDLSREGHLETKCGNIFMIKTRNNPVTFHTLLFSAACLPTVTIVSGDTVKKKPWAKENNIQSELVY